MNVLFYSDNYDFGFLGLERLHPFESHKFSKAFKLARRRLGVRLERALRTPDRPVDNDDLGLVHSQAYLESLASSAVVANALEFDLLRWLSPRRIDSGVLQPMRWATAGTIGAVHAVLSGEALIAMNLGGGFHHAFRDHGEGFCLYADVAVALAVARARGTLKANDGVAVIDLDAHRGNGFWDICGSDEGVSVFDMYNFQTYPGGFPGDLEQSPFQIPMKWGTADEHYLETLRDELPTFLDSLSNLRLAVYNAGTDIVAGDRVGRLAVSYDGVATRDRYVIDTLAARKIPTAVVTSGGYTRHSYKLIADMAAHIVSIGSRRCADIL